jgi:hypothetical protein
VSPKSGMRAEGWAMKRRASDQLSVGRSGVVPRSPDARCDWAMSLVGGQDNVEAVKGVPGKEAFISEYNAPQEGVSHYCASYMGWVKVLPLSPEETDKCIRHCRT